ncbi:hypothetical protein FLW53_09305 [Microbispora sp. SCL1-1]|uniref:recombinase family protein n=1 Tax=unclassified Microbispora TaxID=2614687 RepID=UPI00115AFA37|nr:MULTISPECIES: recombinase family protein [unclassified Microbispora]NJP24395.1 recombinase family protein [Microbispora sp. CL1-1]TQS14549.1 hypothetical protein FLW53_09305 [Microbispora sp. SCL1-1]
MTTPVLRSVIYDRASKDRRQRKSVREQHAENLAANDEHGWRLVGEYVDNNISASRFSKKDRPDWDRFLADLEARTCDVVILWESSRGDRKPSQWMAFLDTCRTLGVFVHVTRHNRTYDMRVARDWRVLAEDGVDNAYESERASERIRRAMRGNAVEGRPHGKVPFGFRRIYDDRTGHLVAQVVDDVPRPAIGPACVTGRAWLLLSAYTRAGVVQELGNRIAAGETLHGLEIDLNRRGVPAWGGGRWTGSQIRALLKKPAYIGKRVHHGELVDSPVWHPRILSDEVFFTCAGKLTDPARSNRRDFSVKHLASGLAVCGVCGGPVRILYKSDYRRSPQYVCRPRTNDGSRGAHVVRNEQRVDEAIERVAVAWMAQPEPLEALSRPDEAGEELQGIQDEIAAARARLDAFYDQAAEGALSAAGLARVEARILAEVEALETRARRLRGQSMAVVARVGNREDAERLWASWTLSQRRELLMELFERIEILPVGKGRHSYTDEESLRLTWRS